MLVSKTVNTNQALIDLIEGEVMAQGSAGTNTGASANFEDLTVGAFDNVLVGDSIHISGVLTAFIVLTRTDANHIIMTTNITPAHTADGIWRAKRGGIGVSALQWSPNKDAIVAGKWHVFYNATNFTV